MIWFVKSSQKSGLVGFKNKLFWQNQAGDSYVCSYTSKSEGGVVTFREAEGRREWPVISNLHCLHAYIIHISINSPTNIWPYPGQSNCSNFSSFL